MAILQSIEEARRGGANDDIILQNIIKSNPRIGNSFQQAQQRGAGSSQIIQEIINQNQKKQPIGLLQKTLQGRTIQQLGVGAVKQFGRTLQTIGQAALASPVLIPGGKKFRERLREIREETGFRPETLERRGKAQKVGAFVAGIAEFFVPNIFLTKGVKIALKVSTASDTLKILGRGAIEAGEVAGVSAAQGRTIEQVKQAGVIGGGLSIAGGGLGKIANTEVGRKAISFLSERIPARILNSILRPREKAFDFGRDPGKGVVKEGITANSRGQLLTKISQKKQDIGKQIESKLSPIKETKDYSLIILKPIDDAIDKAVKGGEQDLVNRLQAVRNGLTKTFELGDDGKIIITGNKNLILNPLQAQKIKIELGQNTRWTGQAFDNDINQVRVAVYRNINDLIENSAKGSKPLQQRYANLLTAEKSLERTNKRLEKLNLIALRQAGIGGIGFGASIVAGDSPFEAVLKGVAVGVAFKAIGSTPSLTNIAQGLTKLKPQQREKVFELVPLLRNIFLGTREQ